MKTLQTFPGIGRWTANYFFAWLAGERCFLPDDYLIKQRFPGNDTGAIRRYAERWKPRRSLCAVAYLVYGRLANQTKHDVGRRMRCERLIRPRGMSDL